ncbi:hypothetical protein H6G97_47615 [Nostoc flagelliforme FACHB-838]|uniref:Uncharacterized protein n=1 Tax=Nostoc flagelliforme FACHB-838 TaxID=2692904 RepID=A0ABR8E557_9NOSO|nr:hypothetical protein [Nostoc flagelliforme]MBD2536538.1 hypothetical protein [Nostoc flagelliforme FACHB-838]
MLYCSLKTRLQWRSPLTQASPIAAPALIPAQVTTAPPQPTISLRRWRSVEGANGNHWFPKYN